MHVADDIRIKISCRGRGVFGHAADDLGNVMSLKLRISRVDPFRRKREQKIFVDLETGGVENRQEHFVSGAGISSRFENHQLSVTQTLLDLVRCGQNIRDVGLFSFSQRRGHANDDRITFLQQIKVGGGSQTSSVDRLSYQIGTYVANVGSAGIYFRSLLFVDFESNHAEPLGGKLGGQRQPHVPESNHPDPRTPLLYEINEFVFNHEQVSVNEG